MKTVYKYQLQMSDVTTMDIPATGEVLSVQVQNDQFVVYILVNTNEIETRKVAFRVAGTGRPISDVYCETFIGTVKLAENLMFHIFYREEN